VVHLTLISPTQTVEETIIQEICLQKGPLAPKGVSCLPPRGRHSVGIIFGGPIAPTCAQKTGRQ
jgi:hypothetical protein